MKKVLETRLSFGAEGAEKLVELYRTHVGNYPKFFKMDPLCRLGFVASEMLLNQENPRKHNPLRKKQRQNRKKVKKACRDDKGR